MGRLYTGRGSLRNAKQRTPPVSVTSASISFKKLFWQPYSTPIAPLVEECAALNGAEAGQIATL